MSSINIEEVPLKELMQGRSKFCYYQSGSLVYLTLDSNFRFEIPVEDLGSARLCVQEPNSLLMKWIRRQKRINQEALAEQCRVDEVNNGGEHEPDYQ